MIKTAPTGFRHEALLYEGDAEFISGSAAFVKSSLVADAAVLVVVRPHKIAMLRDALGDDADEVGFADMATIGRNPGRIISAWHDFVDALPTGQSARGIGEPIDTTRGPEELIECERHEALINLAFADAHDFWLLCPYDTSALDPAVIATSANNHPHLARGDASWPSDTFTGLETALTPFDTPLSEPPRDAETMVFDGAALAKIRRYVGRHARAAGVRRRRADDFVLAVSEVAANSVRHGGGRGTLLVWRDPTALVCEIRDAGRNLPPLAGRSRPDAERISGRGLWMANALCDLVQLRSVATGVVVRLQLSV